MKDELKKSKKIKHSRVDKFLQMGRLPSCLCRYFYKFATLFKLKI